MRPIRAGARAMDIIRFRHRACWFESSQTETPRKAAGVFDLGASRCTRRLSGRTRRCSSGERPLILNRRHDPHLLGPAVQKVSASSALRKQRSFAGSSILLRSPTSRQSRLKAISRSSPPPTLAVAPSQADKILVSPGSVSLSSLLLSSICLRSIMARSRRTAIHPTRHHIPIANTGRVEDREALVSSRLQRLQPKPGALRFLSGLGRTGGMPPLCPGLRLPLAARIISPVKDSPCSHADSPWRSP
jgi:hypothetical protein